MWRKRLIQWGAVALLLGAAPLSAAPPGPMREGELLSLGQSISLARERHPSLTAARNTLRIHEGRTGQAQSAYYPQLNVSSGYSRTDPMSASGSRAVGTAYDQYAHVFSLQQNLWDFHRTSLQVEIQELQHGAARWDLENVTIQVVFGVHQAYYGLLAAQRNLGAAREAVGQYEDHLARAKGLFAAGTRPKFDVTKAEVDLAQARLEQIRAENAVRIARTNLNHAMGAPDAPAYEISDPGDAPAEIPTLAEVLRAAYERRPDLRALRTRQESQDRSVDLAGRGYWPALTGSASYGWGGDSFPWNEGWSVGATLTVPLFSGFSTRHQIEEAKANRDVLAANEEALRQTIHLEVEQAWLNLRETTERIAAAAATLRQAEDNYALARGRYAAGVGYPLEVTDALIALTNARTGYIRAGYDRRMAHVGLEKAMGELP